MVCKTSTVVVLSSRRPQRVKSLCDRVHEMGTGASVESLPPTIDKPTAKSAAGGQFDEAAFDKAAVDGVVTKEEFLNAIGTATVLAAEDPQIVKRTPSGKKLSEAAAGETNSSFDDEAEVHAPDDDEEAEAAAEEAADVGTSANPLQDSQQQEQVATSTSSTISDHLNDEERSAITSALRESFVKNDRQMMKHDNPKFFHGWLGSSDMKPPKCLWQSTEKPRKDHAAPGWLTASEYEDVPEVMSTKIKQLAKLIRLSKHTVVYSGAGISASAVGQAAKSGVNKTGWLEKTKAKPTMTHHALAVLGRAGIVHGWVQQNHDGLPQKAGFPQGRICECHGSWYDPSNPVVKYCGSLKDHEAEWMEKETEDADLVLVMGTSLGGLYADQVATRCAQRALGSLRGRPRLGSVIINLQQVRESRR